MGTNCCNCGDIRCDEDRTRFDIDRYKASEIKCFTDFSYKKFERFDSFAGENFNEPEKLVEEETISFVSNGRVFENNKGQKENSTFSFSRQGYRVVRSETSVRSKIALRFEIDDVFDWGEENSYGHKLINSIYFRPLTELHDDGKAIDKYQQTIEDAGVGEAMGLSSSRSFFPFSPLPIGKKQEHDPDLENRGIEYVIYKLAEDESMPSSMKEFDQKFESNEKIPYLTKKVTKIFEGATLQDVDGFGNYDILFDLVLDGEFRNTGKTGIAKVEFGTRDIRSDMEQDKKIKEAGFFQGSFMISPGPQNNTEIPYEKISSNGSYVILIDCPNVGISDSIGNRACIDLRRINGVDSYQIPQKFLKTDFVPVDPDNPLLGSEIVQEAIPITEARCEPRVDLPNIQTVLADFVDFDLETTPRNDPTSRNDMSLFDEKTIIDAFGVVRSISPSQGDYGIQFPEKDFELGDESGIVDWHDKYKRVGKGEYVTKDSMMDTRISFDNFFRGVDYFLAGGKVQLEVFKEKTNNLKSGIGETYLKTIHELSYDRELEMMYDRDPSCSDRSTTAINDIVSIATIDPSKLTPNPDRFTKGQPSYKQFSPLDHNGGFLTGNPPDGYFTSIEKSKSSLLTTPSKIVKSTEAYESFFPGGPFIDQTTPLVSLPSKRSFWCTDFKPGGNQAKYVHRFMYRVLEGSSRFKNKEYVSQEFLSLHRSNQLIPLGSTDLRANGKLMPAGCFGSSAYYLTSPVNGLALITGIKTRDLTRTDNLVIARFPIKKFIGHSDASDIKYQTQLTGVGSRYGSEDTGDLSRINFLSTIYIRQCVIESGSGLVDVDADLDLFSPNKTHNYASVPHYGQFSPSKFSFKLINPQYFPLAVDISDVNDDCPKECFVMEHPLEWDLKLSDWDVGEPSELSNATYTCDTILNHNMPVSKWGGSYTVQSSSELVLASYVSENSVVYATEAMAATCEGIKRGSAFSNEISIVPDYYINIDTLGQTEGPVGRERPLCNFGEVSQEGLEVYKVGRSHNNNPHTSFSHPSSIFVPSEFDDENDALFVYHGMDRGYNDHYSGLTMRAGINGGVDEHHFFQHGSTSYSIDTGSFIVENFDDIFDIIDSKPKEVEGKYGEGHKISVSEVTWQQVQYVTEKMNLTRLQGGRYVSERGRLSVKPEDLTFDLEECRDFIIGKTLTKVIDDFGETESGVYRGSIVRSTSKGLDLGYGFKEKETGTTLLTEITPGVSEYKFALDNKGSQPACVGNRFGAIVLKELCNFPFYQEGNIGAGLRFRINKDNQSFENDMLFAQEIGRDAIGSPFTPDKVAFQPYNAIKNGYAQLLYQQYIPAVDCPISKFINPSMENLTGVNSEIIRNEIASLIKDTDVKKYWYKIFIDSIVHKSPNEEGYSQTEIKSLPTDTKVLEVFEDVHSFIEIDDDLFSIAGQDFEVKNEFFNGSVEEVLFRNGDLVAVDQVIMRTKFGDTIRDVTSPIRGNIESILSKGDEISNRDVLAVVRENRLVKSPVAGRIMEISKEGEIDGEQTLAKIVNTTNIPQDSYFYIDQEGNDIGPFTSPEGFVFKKSTDEYEVRDEIVFDLKGAIVKENRLKDVAEQNLQGGNFHRFAQREFDRGIYTKQTGGNTYEVSFDDVIIATNFEGEINGVNTFNRAKNVEQYRFNSTDFGISTLPDKFIEPVSEFVSDDILTTFTEWNADKTLSTFPGSIFGPAFDVGYNVLELQAGYYTAPFETKEGTVEITKTAPDVFNFQTGGTDGKFCFEVSSISRPLQCSQCNTAPEAICADAIETSRIEPNDGTPLPQNNFCAPGGSEVTFVFETSSTTNSSERWNYLYKLAGQNRGAYAQLSTFFGISDAFNTFALNDFSFTADDLFKDTSEWTGNQFAKVVKYRKLVKKSEFSKCENLPNVMFDYSNLVNLSEFSEGGSPEAHITTEVEFRDLPLNLTSDKIRHGSDGDIINETIFPTDQQLSSVKSILDQVPETVSRRVFPSFFSPQTSAFPAPLNKNRRGIADSANSLYLDTYDFFPTDKYKNEIDRIHDLLTFFGASLELSTITHGIQGGIAQLLYAHLYGRRGTTGWNISQSSNSVRPPDDEKLSEGRTIGGACKVSALGIPMPPGDSLLAPNIDTCCTGPYHIGSLIAYSTGQSVFRLANSNSQGEADVASSCSGFIFAATPFFDQIRWGTGGICNLKEVGFDFSGSCLGYDLNKRSLGPNVSPRNINENQVGFTAGKSFKDVYGSSSNGDLFFSNPISLYDTHDPFSFEPFADPSPGAAMRASVNRTLPLTLAVNIKRKIVPLSEYFFIIGDAKSEDQLLTLPQENE